MHIIRGYDTPNIIHVATFHEVVTNVTGKLLVWRGFLNWSRCSPHHFLIGVARPHPLPAPLFGIRPFNALWLCLHTRFWTHSFHVYYVPFTISLFDIFCKFCRRVAAVCVRRFSPRAVTSYVSTCSVWRYHCVWTSIRAPRLKYPCITW